MFISYNILDSCNRWHLSNFSDSPMTSLSMASSRNVTGISSPLIISSPNRPVRGRVRANLLTLTRSKRTRAVASRTSTVMAVHLSSTGVSVHESGCLACQLTRAWMTMPVWRHASVHTPLVQGRVTGLKHRSKNDNYRLIKLIRLPANVAWVYV